MVECNNCEASVQDGEFCEECSKPPTGSRGVSKFCAYKMHVLVVAVVGIAVLGLFAMLSSMTAARSSASSSLSSVADVINGGGSGCQSKSCSIAESIPLVASRAAVTTNASAVNADGYQEIDMKISGGFVPNTFTVKAGQPVKWTITGERVTGCVHDVVQRDFGVNVPISNGETKTVTFTPTKLGTYTFTCGMGMVKGRIKVVDPVTGIAPGPTGVGGVAEASCREGCGCGDELAAVGA